MDPRPVVLVEGESDLIALCALAARTRQDLAGVEIVALGGITNLRAHALRLGPLGEGRRLLGLYDIGEERHVRRGLAAAGIPVAPDEGGPARRDFHACVVDLEDELLRSLGPDGVEAVIDAAGDSTSLRLLAGMPAQRDWTREQVLRRFLTSQSGRKARYARLCVQALDLDRAPAPLTAVLAAVAAT
ncbi:MAG: hypothetical protein C0493_00020 [Kytococcus sp.]|nr:hypothetical protein [Kytococcus sp.]